ncbi:FixH family protein [Parahaliea aestuarii]|uniref:FixH family protein n=1 Tax=Parahaliea aestuarii TaxID=1852021 RepID=A0A5C8ZUH4_9GAMM|nr:FixH family protein [Parahaliea aestuarii]TXS91459.1 FixH family protein [Parahaliea aestuarii]
MSSLREAPTLPWYRQFWPWFLIALPACAVVASLWTMVIAHTGADDLVVDEYYKDGLAINRELAKRQRAEAAGIEAALQLQGDALLVTTRGPVQERQLRLSISHPMEADRDFALPLMQASPGHYRARLPRLPEPGWHWVLESEGEPVWRLDGQFKAADFGDAGRG